MASGEAIAEEAEVRRNSFLEAYRLTGSVSAAAAAAGVSRQHTSHWKKICPVFAREVQLIRDRHSVGRLVVAMEATQ